MPRPLTAFLIDDEVYKRPKLKEIWTAILAPLASTVEVKTFQTVEEAREELHTRPHVAIVDNVYVKETGEMENEGVGFIADERPSHLDTMFILHTEQTFSVEQLGRRHPNPDMIVTKINSTSESYQDYIRGHIRSFLRRTPLGTLVFSDLSEQKIVESYQNEFRSIVEQCLFVFNKGGSGDPIEQVSLKPLKGGYSGSEVFLIDIASSERYENVPFVLKVSKSEFIHEEVDRYNRYVRLQISHDMRVDLVGHGTAGEYSGVLYAFAFGSRRRVKPASDALRAGDMKAINRITKRVFDATRIGWYNAPRPAEDVSTYYNNNLEYEPHKDDRRKQGLKHWAEILSGDDYCRIADEEINIAGFKCLPIRRIISKMEKLQVLETIVHGDFNSNNIFFGASASNIALIDFEYSGFDMVFKDYVSLEMSIRTEFKQPEPKDALPLGELIKSEHFLLSTGDVSDGDALPYLCLCRDVRKSACDKFSGIDRRLYLIGVAFHAFKLLGIPAWNNIQAARLLSAYVAACLQLESLGFARTPKTLS